MDSRPDDSCGLRSDAPQRITVIGLGRVGLVNAACFAARGHSVIGIDSNREVVTAINRAECPFLDPELEGLLVETVSAGLLRAERETRHAIQNANFIFCCVGTPHTDETGLDLTQFERAIQSIGDALKSAVTKPIIVVRCTVPPQTMSGLVVPILEQRSKKKCHEGFEVAFVPEFLREGSAVEDFKHSTRTIIGVQNIETYKRISQLMAPFSRQCVKVSFELAELSKLMDNAWHSTKVAFANELGNIAAAISQDSQQLLELLCLDDKQNLSSAYLRPGFAFGGPCLPKDLGMLSSFAKQNGVRTPLLSGVQTGNDEQIERAKRFIHGLGVRRITLVGAEFKTGTSRLLGSPQMLLMERLWQDGFDVQVHASIAHHIDHPSTNSTRTCAARRISELPFNASLEDAIDFGELIVIGQLNSDLLRRTQAALNDKVVLDLGSYPSMRKNAKAYFCVREIAPSQRLCVSAEERPTPYSVSMQSTL